MHNTDIIFSSYFLIEKLENIIYHPTTHPIIRDIALSTLIFLEKLMESRLEVEE